MSFRMIIVILLVLLSPLTGHAQDANSNRGTGSERTESFFLFQTNFPKQTEKLDQIQAHFLAGETNHTGLSYNSIFQIPTLATVPPEPTLLVSRDYELGRLLNSSRVSTGLSSVVLSTSAMTAFPLPQRVTSKGTPNKGFNAKRLIAGLTGASLIGLGGYLIASSEDTDCELADRIGCQRLEALSAPGQVSHIRIHVAGRQAGGVMSILGGAAFLYYAIVVD